MGAALQRLTRQLAALALAGCGPGETPRPPSTSLQAEVAVSAEVPTVLHVSWTTDVPGRSWVEYGRDDLDQSTPITAADTEHAMPVLGLKAGETYHLRAVTDIDGERHESPTETLQIAPVPDWYGRFSISQHEPGSAEMTDGYLLVGASVAIGGEFSDVGSFVAILDGDGDYVWFYDLPPGVGTLSPSISGDRILWDAYDSYVSDDLATATALDLTGHGPAVSTPLPDGHHVAIESEPGETLTYLARDIQTVSVNDQDVTIQTDRIRRKPVGATTEPEEVFTLFDTLQGDFHWPCTHTLEPHSRTDHPQLYEWTHGNSLIHHDDALYLYTRWTDTLYKIDPDLGEVAWQLGGPDSDFTQPSGDPVWVSATESALWSHGHLSQLWDGGLVLFDNGSHRSPKVSGIAEYRVDETEMTVEEVFRFDDPLGRYMGAVGDVRKLPGGNYLASWTTWGELTEITPQGEIVWRASSTAGHATARIHPISDLYAQLSSQE